MNKKISGRFRNEVTEAAAKASLLSELLQDDLVERFLGILIQHGRIAHYSRGEIICRKGDYGSEIHFVLNGRVCEITDDRSKLAKVANPPTVVAGGKSNWFRKLFHRTEEDIVVIDHLYRQRYKNVDEILQNCEYRQYFPSLCPDKLSVGSKATDVLGTFCVVSYSPYYRTMFAESSVTLLSIHRRGVNELIALSKNFQHLLLSVGLDEVTEYFLSRLFDLPIFAQLPDESLMNLARTMKLELINNRSNQLEYLSQGQSIEHPILVLFGIGRLRHRFSSNMTRSVGFVHRGDMFGIAALAVRGRDASSLTSLEFIGNSSVLRLDSDILFNDCLRHLSFDDIAAADPGSIMEIRKSDPTGFALSTFNAQKDEMINFFVDNKFIRGSQAMLIDQSKCVGCDACVQACADTHHGIPRFLRTGVVNHGYVVARACMHCEEAPCLVNCPTGAIFRKHSSEVIISETLCIGCGTCAAACPYGNIHMVEIGASIQEKEGSEPIAIKCDLCIDNPRGPACERACPHDALARVDMTNHHLMPLLASSSSLRKIKSTLNS